MKTINFGYTDTPIQGVTSLEFDRGLLNFGADFDVSEDKNGETTLINITTPRSKPEKIRLAYTVVPDIYKNTGINPSVQAANISGVSVLVQLTEVATITDSSDASYEVQVPLSVHTVIRVPAIEQVTEAHVLTALGRLISCLFDTGSESDSRLKKILRGALKPSDI